MGNFFSEKNLEILRNNKILLPMENILTLDKTKLSALKRLKIERVVDLLLYKPSYYQKRLIHPSLSKLAHGNYVIIKGKVSEVLYPKAKSGPTKISIFNDSGSIVLVFFKLHKYLQSIFKIGAEVTVSGKVEFYDFRPQINHPEILYDKDLITKNEPIYPLTYGITNSQIRKYIIKAIRYCGEINEWLPDGLISEYGLPSFMQAVRKIHAELGEVSLSKSLLRLKIDEALSNQMGFRYIKEEARGSKGRIFEVNEKIKNSVISELPFDLTEDQEKVLKEIEQEQASNLQMLRMLQGDVGCGKTIVAMLSAINVITSGAQVALMAPTEVLAEQHYNLASKIFEPYGIRVGLLTGKMPSKKKNEMLEANREGRIDFLLGTHSLFQEKVQFKDLGYVIVDEQHRFGVEQRMELVSKGSHPDILIMSATPIPRSLSLTMFGDLALSVIKSMPKTRKEVKTIISSISKIEDVCKAAQNVISRAEKIFWICPLIEVEEGKSNFIDVETRFNYLSSIFGSQVEFLHGGISGEDKSKILSKLKEGEIKILVSTTVIEVGIDIPDATLIVIENAEKFGLAQLHQLRGRVGRGDKESTCILLYGKQVSAVAFERFKIMKESRDGFFIAEKDLLLRGEGELLGSRQSGEQNFKFLDLSSDGSIISRCNNIASGMEINKDRLLQMMIYNSKMLAAINMA